MSQPDIRRAKGQWDSDTVPAVFVFHHYDEPAGKPLVCLGYEGTDEHVVRDPGGGYYGVYGRDAVRSYLESGTWLIIDPDPETALWISKQVPAKNDVLGSLVP